MKGDQGRAEKSPAESGDSGPTHWRNYFVGLGGGGRGEGERTQDKSSYITTTHSVLCGEKEGASFRNTSIFCSLDYFEADDDSEAAARVDEDKVCGDDGDRGDVLVAGRRGRQREVPLPGPHHSCPAKEAHVV